MDVRNIDESEWYMMIVLLYQPATVFVSVQAGASSTQLWLLLYKKCKYHETLTIMVVPALGKCSSIIHRNWHKFLNYNYNLGVNFTGKCPPFNNDNQTDGW